MIARLAYRSDDPRRAVRVQLDGLPPDDDPSRCGVKREPEPDGLAGVAGSHRHRVPRAVGAARDAARAVVVEAVGAARRVEPRQAAGDSHPDCHGDPRAGGRAEHVVARVDGVERGVPTRPDGDRDVAVGVDRRGAHERPCPAGGPLVERHDVIRAVLRQVRRQRDGLAIAALRRRGLQAERGHDAVHGQDVRRPGRAASLGVAGEGRGVGVIAARGRGVDEVEAALVGGRRHVADHGLRVVGIRARHVDGEPVRRGAVGEAQEAEQACLVADADPRPAREGERDRRGHGAGAALGIGGGGAGPGGRRQGDHDGGEANAMCGAGHASPPWENGNDGRQGTRASRRGSPSICGRRPSSDPGEHSGHRPE